MSSSFMHGSPEPEEDTLRGKFLIFSMGEELYGIKIRYVTEIVGIQAITSLPEMPDYIKGIINLRGKIIPVLDVQLKFKQAAAVYTERTCIIVIDTNDTLVGLIVGHVSEVLNMNEDDIVPPPPQSIGMQSKYVYGFGKCNDKVILLLDCEAVIKDNELSIKTTGGYQNEAL